ncbi:MAG TPA: argininosuccinate synthase [Actinomycetota bacterium]|nr:argininosuccinate synthase [Actinomycetota bacterium]
MKKVVLAYSGGLDTSVAIPWLGDQGYEVYAVAIDVGQGGDLPAAVARAKALGAVDARAIDARQEFARDFAFAALKMNALYQGRYPLVSALSRPLIARLLIDVVEQVGADAVAHGCTGKGNDQVRFEVSLAALAPDVEVLAPVRDWGMTRADTIAYAESRSLPITTTKSSPYSVDENLWGRSIECGVLEDPWAAPPDDIFASTAAAADAPGEPLDIQIGFERGIPVSVDHEMLDPVALVDALEKKVGAYGYGRVDIVEDRLVGIKSREIYEAPAALALIAAHADLEALTLERAVAREKRSLDARWADLVYEGLWFSPLKEAIDAFADTTQRHVTGDVRLRITAGGCLVTGRRSPESLYDLELATYDEGDSFDQSDAVGFVKLWGLPSKVHARRARS